MKQTLDCKWWKDEKTEISQEHQDQLKEEGIERANEMIREGYTPGELHSELDGIEYHGWWSLETE